MDLTTLYIIIAILMYAFMMLSPVYDRAVKDLGESRAHFKILLHSIIWVPMVMFLILALVEGALNAIRRRN